MPNPYATMNGPDWMSAAPSPYQQGMQNPYGQAPRMAPGGSSFGDRAAAVGQQLVNQPMGNMGATQAGMSSGLGGSAMDPQKMAAGLRKLGAGANNVINPLLPSTQQATADQYGTDPYSEQSRMLAQQDQGLMNGNS